MLPEHVLLVQHNYETYLCRNTAITFHGEYYILLYQ